MSTGLSRRLDRLVLALLPLSVLAVAIHKLVTYDVWWQMATGAWVLEHGIPRTDPFSYGFPGREWIEPRWLWCLGVHALSRAFGLNALILAKAALVLATLGLLAWHGRARARWVLASGLLVALALLATRLRVRPELVTYLGVTVTIVCLERYRAGGSVRWLWALPVFQLVWSNAHSLALLGPALQGAFVLGEALQGRVRRGTPGAGVLRGARLRSPLVVAGASGLACLATPYGLAGLLFPLTLLEQIGPQSALQELISEFQSPLAHAGLSFFFVSWVLAALLSGLALLANRRGLRVTHLLWWAAFLVLSAMARRNVALFGIVAAVVLTDSLDAWARAAAPGRVAIVRAASRGLCLALVLVLPALVATDRFWHGGGGHEQSFGFGVKERLVPIRAMAFVQAAGLPRPVIGSLGDGGYLLFEGGPGSVYLDGRLEVYGAEAVVQALEVLQTGRGFEQTCARLGVRTAVLRHAHLAPLVARLEAAPDWTAVYFDDRHVVYLRRDDDTGDLADELAIDWSAPAARVVEVDSFLRPPDWLAGLWPRIPDVQGLLDEGDLLRRMGNLDAARDAFERAVELAPGSTRAALHLGLLHEAQGRPAEAAVLLARGDPDDLLSADVLQVRGELAWLAGDEPRSLEWRRQALAAGLDDPALHKDTLRLALQLGQFDVADELLTGLLRRRPGDAEAWGLAGDLETLRGRDDAARVHYERALGIAPREARLHVNLGMIHARAGRFAEARERLEAALTLDPANASARAGLAGLQQLGH